MLLGCCFPSYGRIFLDIDRSGPSQKIDQLFYEAIKTLPEFDSANRKERDNQGLPDRSALFLKEIDTKTSKASWIFSGHASSLRTGMQGQVHRPTLLPWARRDTLILNPLVGAAFPSFADELSSAIPWLEGRVGVGGLFAVLSLDLLGRSCQQAFIEQLPDLDRVRLTRSVWATWTYSEWARLMQVAPERTSVWVACLRPHQLVGLLSALRSTQSDRDLWIVVPFETGVQMLLQGLASQALPVRTMGSNKLKRGVKVVMACPVTPCNLQALGQKVRGIVQAASQDLNEQGRFADNLEMELGQQVEVMARGLWLLLLRNNLQSQP